MIGMLGNQDFTDNELPNKRIRIEQFEDWGYFSIRTGYYEVRIDCDEFKCHLCVLCIVIDDQHPIGKSFTILV